MESNKDRISKGLLIWGSLTLMLGGIFLLFVAFFMTNVLNGNLHELVSSALGFHINVNYVLATATLVGTVLFCWLDTDYGTDIFGCEAIAQLRREEKNLSNKLNEAASKTRSLQEALAGKEYLLRKEQLLNKLSPRTEQAHQVVPFSALCVTYKGYVLEILSTHKMVEPKTDSIQLVLAEAGIVILSDSGIPGVPPRALHDSEMTLSEKECVLEAIKRASEAKPQPAAPTT